MTQILRREQLLGRAGEPRTRPWQRFERTLPNELWQADFKGHFPTQSGERCHPLTVIDDHSRFSLVLSAERNETGLTVQTAFTRAFARYGLPEAILCDNGAPWGGGAYTALTVWLLRLGVRVYHGRPYHPQTQGKGERFHRTLNQDLISRHTWRDLEHCAHAFVQFRSEYNCTRPHDSLDEETPISRYRPSPRSLPSALPPIEYPLHFTQRIVHPSGVIMFGGQTWMIGRAFRSLPVGLRPSPHTDGLWDVFFNQLRLGSIDLSCPLNSRHSLRPLSP